MTDRADDIRYLRGNIEHLQDKAKADLKVALYGSSLFLALSFIPYGELAYASLFVSAIDLWYFMSWGNDQLRLVQDRVLLKGIEGDQGLEARQERMPNYRQERALYLATPAVIVALFAAGLYLDYDPLGTRVWRAVYYGIVGAATIWTAITFFTGWRDN